MNELLCKYVNLKYFFSIVIMWRIKTIDTDSDLFDMPDCYEFGTNYKKIPK